MGAIRIFKRLAELLDVAFSGLANNDFVQRKSGNWTNRTPAQVADDLPAFVGDTGSGGTKGMVPAPASGDATKFLKADGSWGTPGGAGTHTHPTSDIILLDATLSTLSGKQDAITGAATTITGADLTAGRVLISNASGKVGVSAVSAPELTDLSLLDRISGASTQGAVLFRGSLGWSALAPGTAGRVLKTAGAGADPTWSDAIDNDAVTNAKLANMAAGTYKMRVAGSTGDPEDATAAQATAGLDAMVGDSGSGGTKGLVPAPAAGDAAASKYLKADGTWATVSGGGSPGGATTQVQFNDAGAFSGVAGLTVNTTTGALTQLQTALGTTPAAGITLTNTTAAAAGAQQVSPASVWTGQGWKTTATAASQQVDFRAYTLPVQGTSAPTATWKLQSQIASGGWTDRLTVDSQGTVTVGGTLNAGTGAFSANCNVSGNVVIGGDLTIARAAAATLRLGSSDTASPTAQTLRVQSVSSGTSNTAGANFTIQGSRSTGTGSGGDIVFQVSPPGSAGSAQNAFATVLTLKGDAFKCAVFTGPVCFPSYTVAGLPSAATYPYARAFVTDANATLSAGIGTTVAGGGSNKAPVFSDGADWIIG